MFVKIKDHGDVVRKGDEGGGWKEVKEEATVKSQVFILCILLKRVDRFRIQGCIKHSYLIVPEHS